MKKLWNHYESLDIDNVEQGEEYVGPQSPVTSSRPHKKRGALDRLYAWLFHAEEEEAEFELTPPSISAPIAPANDELRLKKDQIQQALNEWKAAAAYFESVVDPELVDYAVYGMEAAQKRYIYLLRSAGKEDGSFHLSQ